LTGGNILAKKQDKQTVLIVDDEPIIRESLRLMLEKSGFEVTMAEDGEQALDIVKK
jgi:CheY-like chemotaxis protein